MSEPLAIVSSPAFADHRPADDEGGRGGGHPERPERMEAVLAAIAEVGIEPIDPGEPVDDETLRLVHPQEHIDAVGRLAKRGGGMLDADTYVGPESDRVARLAVAGGIVAAERVMAGRSKRALVAGRPPGHHALPERAMGFCLYATPAIVVRHLQKHHGIERVAVIDFDVHHGNGTQAVFYEDPSVLTVSLHEDPSTLWPGSGYACERGEGAGEGACLNLPLPAGTGDDAYLAAFSHEALPTVHAFSPDVIVVCAGFDAAAGDPLAHLMLSMSAFGQFGRKLRALADEACEGRLIATLEGGYHLASLRAGITAFATGLTS